MAEERNSENFALGIIVASIVFLLLRKTAMAKMNSGETSKAANVIPISAGSSCGCGGGNSSGCGGGNSSKQAPSQNPGISIGGESYSPSSFAQSSVTPSRRIANYGSHNSVG